MKLNIPERLIITNLLPEKGTFITLKTIEEIKSKMYLSEEEVKEYGVKQQEHSIVYNERGVEKKEIQLTKDQINFIKERLEEISERGEATLQHYAIYKLFSKQTK